MIKIVLLAALFAVAFARPQVDDRERYATVLRSESDASGDVDGRFSYSYATSNNIEAQAEGFIKNPTAREEDQILEIRGQYSYVDPNGQIVLVRYIADENGYRVL